jgi:hypothetical protein
VRQAISLALVFMLGAGASGAQGAEEPANPPVGSRIRITSSAVSGPVVGTLLGVEVDALVLRRAGSDAAVRIPTADIVNLDVSGGRGPQTGRGAMIGAAAGLMPGLLLTFGDYSSDVHGDSHAGTVALIGVASGALLGAAIGRTLKTDNWVPSAVPRAVVAVVPVRRGVAVSFRMTWGNDPR